MQPYYEVLVVSCQASNTTASFLVVTIDVHALLWILQKEHGMVMHALLNPAQRTCQERIIRRRDIALVVHLYKGIRENSKSGVN